MSELKWKSVTTAGVSIPPKSYRSIDALHINNQTPNVAYLGLNPLIVDWGGYYQDHQINGQGDYDLDYVIFSDNFSPSRSKFRLHIDSQLSQSTLNQV